MTTTTIIRTAEDARAAVAAIAAWRAQQAAEAAKEPTEKACTRCAESLPLTEFYTAKGKPSSWCRPCTREVARRRGQARVAAAEERRAARTALAARTREELDAARAEIQHKHCPGCGQIKARESWYANRTSPDGLQSQCISCQSKRAAASLARKARLGPSPVWWIVGVSRDSFLN